MAPGPEVIDVSPQPVSRYDFPTTVCDSVQPTTAPLTLKSAPATVLSGRGDTVQGYRPGIRTPHAEREVPTSEPPRTVSPGGSKVSASPAVTHPRLPAQTRPEFPHLAIRFGPRRRRSSGWGEFALPGGGNDSRGEGARGDGSPRRRRSREPRCQTPESNRHSLPVPTLSIGRFLHFPRLFQTQLSPR